MTRKEPNENYEFYEYRNTQVEENMRDTYLRSGVLGTLLILIFLFAGCTTHPEDDETIRTEKPSFDDPTYVGSEKCRDCHWNEHDVWKHTLHSKFMQIPDEYSVIGDFRHDNTLSVTVAADSPQRAGETVTSTMYMKGDKYFVRTLGPDFEPHDYEVNYVIGLSRKQNYVTELENGQMHILPIEWDASKKIWVDYYGLKNHYPDDGKYWSDLLSIWQFRCAGCHVTGLSVNYNLNTGIIETKWVDLGIGCEACHGPASNHIKAAREYFAYEQETIINPAKLPWRLRAMVCGQCHNWGSSVEKVFPNKKGFPSNYSYPVGYTPGKPLYLYFRENPDDERKHHQQYNEWETSRHAEAGIMCTVCHDVHQESEHETPKMAMTQEAANKLCESCHTTMLRRAAHRIHTYGSCIACHMTKTKGNEHNHTFQFISPKESVKAGGTKYKMNSCSACHHHKDTPLEDLVEFLDAVKKQDMPKPFSAHKRR